MAGFFGMFDYSKPGKGVNKDGPEKKRFFLFFEIYFRKFWKLMALNLLYFVACIPIVTIGPATAGMTYILRNFAREEHAFLWWDFRDAFKSNWKQALVVSGIDLAAIAIGYFNFTVYSSLVKENYLFNIAVGLMIFIYVMYVFMRFYIYTLMVTFELRFKDLIRNSFIFAVLGLFKNLLVLVLTAILVAAAVLFFPISLLFIPIILFSTIGFITVFTTWPVIQKYMIDAVKGGEGEEEADSKTEEEPIEGQQIFTDALDLENRDKKKRR